MFPDATRGVGLCERLSVVKGCWPFQASWLVTRDYKTRAQVIYFHHRDYKQTIESQRRRWGGQETEKEREEGDEREKERRDSRKEAVEEVKEVESDKGGGGRKRRHFQYPMVPS